MSRQCILERYKLIAEENGFKIMQKSRHIKMLFSWIYNVCVTLKFRKNVLSLTLYLAGKYLSLKSTCTDDLQCCGIVALNISNIILDRKNESIFNYLELTDNSVTASSFIKMNKSMCETLDYKFFYVTPYILSLQEGVYDELLLHASCHPKFYLYPPKDKIDRDFLKYFSNKCSKTYPLKWTQEVEYDIVKVST